MELKDLFKKEYRNLDNSGEIYIKINVYKANIWTIIFVYIYICICVYIYMCVYIYQRKRERIIKRICMKKIYSYPIFIIQSLGNEWKMKSNAFLSYFGSCSYILNEIIENE